MSQKLSHAEWVRRKRAYQRAYYNAHKEKAKEYQRQYNLTHRKRQSSRGKSPTATTEVREVRKTSVTRSDLLHSPTEKTLQYLTKVLKGEMLLVH